MTMSSSFENSKFADMMEAVNNACDLLRVSGRGQDVVEVALNVAPRCVVIGGQSWGKSSFLSRVSRIRFPSDGERCTLMATLLKMKKTPGDPLLIVSILGSHKEKAINVEIGRGHPDATDSEALIREAQKRALAIVQADFPEKSFVEDIDIVVDVQSPDGVNLTLVDLPGFVEESATNNDKAVVNAIAKRYCNREASIIVYIGLAAEHPDRFSGMPIISDHTAKTIMVLNKLDQISDPNVLDQNLARIESRFAAPHGLISGISQTPAEENAFFKDSARAQVINHYRDKFHVGCTELLQYLCVRFEEHVRASIPKLVRVLREQYDQVHLKLSEIKHWDAIEELSAMKEKCHERFMAKMKTREDLFAKEREALTDTILNLGIRPIGDTAAASASTHATSPNPRKATSLDVFVGAHVLVANPAIKPAPVMFGASPAKFSVKTSAPDNLVLAEILKCESPASLLCQVESEPKPLKLGISEMWTRNDVPPLISDIRKLALESKGLRNLENVDFQVILEKYAVDFAERYRVVLQHHFEKVFRETAAYFQSCIREKGLSEPHTEVINSVASIMTQKLESVQQEANASVLRLFGHNSEKSCIFHADESHFESNAQDFLEELFKTEVPPEDKTSFELLARVMVYIKYQSQYLVEAASKDMTLIIYEKANKAFLKTLSEFHKPEQRERMETEPADRAEQRARLLGEANPLKAALDAMEGIVQDAEYEAVDSAS